MQNDNPRTEAVTRSRPDYRWDRGGSINVIAKRESLPSFDAAGFCRTCRYGPPEDDQVKTAIAFLSQVRPSKRPTISSYILKHRAEDWGKRNGLEPYVSNGAMIAAAIRLDLVIERHGINATIGVSKRDVRTLRERYG
jgi:hypothetical protein